MHKERIIELLKSLNEGLYEREEIISVSLLSALAGQNIFLYGPPGTAKSLISKRIAQAFKTKHYFEHLMQKFSTPEEVFGPISITELKQDNYIRKTQGFLPEAEFAFLDEIWKSSPAILNTLLTIINEKKFKNGTEVKAVPLKVLISASNETPPEKQGLEALYDRFLTRLFVPPISDKDNFEAILQNGDSFVDIEMLEELKIKDKELQEWRDEIQNIKLSEDTLQIINGIRNELEEQNKTKEKEELIYVSDRRWQKAAILLKASAFFCDREETNIADCLLLNHCLWSKSENRLEIQKIIETTIEACGFKTEISLLTLDEKKDNLEKEILNEIFYATDVYKTEKLNNSKKEFLKYEMPENYQHYIAAFYIPYNQMKKDGNFNPLDESGNEIKWIRCNFMEQGSFNIEINKDGKNDSYYLNEVHRWRKIDPPFTPKILFHKGDKKTDVNVRLIEALVNAVVNLTSEMNATLNKITDKTIIFEKELENPFLPVDKTNIAITSINKQITELRLRIKDCERLANLVSR